MKYKETFSNDLNKLYKARVRKVYKNRQGNIPIYVDTIYNDVVTFDRVTEDDYSEHIVLHLLNGDTVTLVSPDKCVNMLFSIGEQYR